MDGLDSRYGSIALALSLSVALVSVGGSAGLVAGSAGPVTDALDTGDRGLSLGYLAYEAVSGHANATDERGDGYGSGEVWAMVGGGAAGVGAASVFGVAAGALVPAGIGAA
jgi:hypothetical protein